MFPEHCREVGVKKVEFQLTADEIKKQLENHKLYTATKYLILHNENEWAVCKISKEEGFELFRNITNIEVISLPSETLYVEDPAVDVLNPSKLVGKAEDVTAENGAKTVVVKGEFDHISFAHNEKLLPLVVFETAPPNPPKLVKLVERVLTDGKLTKPLKLIPEFINVQEMAAAADADTIIFPCRTSGLSVEGKRILYLDELPDLELMEGAVVLTGCSLSDRIFKSHYHRKPELINICPAEKIGEIMDKYTGTPIILKCCKLKEDYEIEGNVIKVPWGTTTRIIEDALNDYFERSKPTKKEA
jgi:hypothetical protein